MMRAIKEEKEKDKHLSDRKILIREMENASEENAAEIWASVVGNENLTLSCFNIQRV